MSLIETINDRNSDDLFFAPSLLAADLSQVAREVAQVEAAGVEMLHVDVMDGHFVPNLSFGVPFVKMLKKITHVPLDVHLMIDNADETLPWYLDAGADSITLHAEASTHLHRSIRTIKEAGAAASVSLNPATPLSALEEVLAELDMVLLMSVNPGFGGQSYIQAVTQKTSNLVTLCAQKSCNPLIQIDGGITIETIPESARAGARCFVAGSAVFNALDPQVALEELRNTARLSIAQNMV